MSEVLRALYEGREVPDDALTHELDVFEAAAVGSLERLTVLLQHDTDLARAWTEDGFTALHYACYFGTPAAVEVLLGAGADPEVPSRNAMGVRPINAAAAGRHPAGAVAAVLAAGANVDGRQTSGHTALDEARLRDDRALIELLLAHGAGDSEPR